MATATDLFPPRYRDPELVARGGMGEVYRALDVSLGRTVAIKLLDERLAWDPAVRRRFEREGLAAARLSGEVGIVTIFDVGAWNSRPFIVMEYIRGRSLQDVVQDDGPQPPADVLDWLEQTARALDHAHAQGVVHRDVKPSNLLLDEEGRVRMVDFGVASAAGLDSLTQTGTVIGTAGYLAPEQARGEPATPASDRYALGIVAFELLAGSRPFESASSTAEAAAHIHAPIPSLTQTRPDIPAAVDGVLDRALAKDPARRFASCRVFVAALRAAFDVTNVPARIAVGRTRRRSRALPVLVLLGLAGIVAGAVVATHRGGAPARAPNTAAARQPTATAGASASGVVSSNTSALALQGYDKLRAGDYAGALPLLEQAAHQLDGSGTLDEAYNDYNLAYALAKAQGCSAQVLRLLKASESIQGHRSEIDRLRSECSG